MLKKKYDSKQTNSVSLFFFLDQNSNMMPKKETNYSTHDPTVYHIVALLW